MFRFLFVIRKLYKDKLTKQIYLKQYKKVWTFTKI